MHYSQFICTWRKQRCTICLLLLFCWLMTACSEGTNPAQQRQTPYFDLATLVERQIARLDSLNPEVAVTARIGEQTQTQTFLKDSAGWAETLELFAEADLNKPVLIDQYLVQDSVLNDSATKMRVYRAKRPQKVDIQYLKVTYQDSLAEVRSVEALFREENPLYTTQRQMTLEFDEAELLQTYRTLGKQKMIFRDSVLYQTEGKLIY